MASRTNDRQSLSIAEYAARADFRYQIRRFFRISEEVARAAGLNPRQYELLLAVKGLPETEKATIRTLAERLQVRHHSTVELIDRLEKRGLVERVRDGADRRQVLVRLTPSGEDTLLELSLPLRAELRSIAPELVQALAVIVDNTKSVRYAAPPTRRKTR
ncbi:MAG TPA: MarR family transcriptional regulator [Acidobacteriota bacterium]|jgi:DNA-binding MarR family transcriptional regulator